MLQPKDTETQRHKSTKRSSMPSLFWPSLSCSLSLVNSNVYGFLPLADCALETVNSVAGGGSFLISGARLYGVPSIIANATSTVALFPGARDARPIVTISGARRVPLRAAIIVSIAGGIAGRCCCCSHRKTFDVIIVVVDGGDGGLRIGPASHEDAGGNRGWVNAHCFAILRRHLWRLFWRRSRHHHAGRLESGGIARHSRDERWKNASRRHHERRRCRLFHHCRKGLVAADLHDARRGRHWRLCGRAFCAARQSFPHPRNYYSCECRRNRCIFPPNLICYTRAVSRQPIVTFCGAITFGVNPMRNRFACLLVCLMMGPSNGPNTGVPGAAARRTPGPQRHLAGDEYCKLGPAGPSGATRAVCNSAIGARRPGQSVVEAGRSHERGVAKKENTADEGRSKPNATCAAFTRPYMPYPFQIVQSQRDILSSMNTPRRIVS